MQSKLTILHVSDFHFTKRKLRDQGVVVDAIIADIEDLCRGHRRPDVVMFTGDLVNAPSSDRHDHAYDFFLSRVLKATKCSDERLIIVPGNHDVDRGEVENSVEIHSKWQKNSNSMNDTNLSFEEDEFSEIANKKFAAYLELENYLSDGNLKYKNSFVAVYHINALNIDVVIFNSSMLSTGGYQHPNLEADEGNLIIPEYAVLDAFKYLSEGSFKIFSTHHPLTMFSEEGARFLRKEIQRHADIHLFGHMHDPNTANISGYEGELYSDQAGAVFTARKSAYIGYSLICVDRDTKLYETHLRTYFDDRKVFDEAVDIIKKGIFYSSQEAREYWRNIAVPVDENAFCNFLSTNCVQEINKELAQNGIKERDGSEEFISPPLIRAAIEKSTGDIEKSAAINPISIDELIDSDENLIIYGATEYGKTTILRELQFRLFKDAKSLNFARLPIVVDFADVKINDDNLLRVVKSRAIDCPSFTDILSLLKLGHVCLLFDDVVFSDNKRMDVLRKFVSRFPKCRYVFSSLKNATALYGAHVVPEMPIQFESLEVCELRRREMRKLVANSNNNADVDVVLDKLQSEINEINLPFTAANGSILLEIYAEHSGPRAINRSVLIEQYVDTRLKKSAVDQSQREIFDYANKTALLAHIAGWMAQKDEYRPKVDDVLSCMKEYVDNLGLNASLDALFVEFINAGLFARRSDLRMSFRYRSVLEYFIAIQMLNDLQFKSWVMEEARYLKFPNEIQYYSGKLRNDLELVDDISDRFTELVQSVVEVVGEMDLGHISSLRLPKGEGNSTIDKLGDQLLQEPLTVEERDQELEAEFPHDIEERQEVFRPNIDNPSQRLLTALFLYSGVVKNMELISDADKRRHLDLVWLGWAVFLQLSLSIVEELSHRRKVRINGVLYEINAPIGMSDNELARIIALKMPVGITNLISANLGTEKLERQLTEPLLTAKKPPKIFEFFRASLIADLRLHSASGALVEALESFKDSDFLLEALIFKISDLRRMSTLSQPQFDKIISPVAGAIARLKGASGSELNIEKQKQIKRIRQEEVLLKMKRQNLPY